MRLMVLDLMGRKPLLHKGREAGEEVQISGVATPTEMVSEKGKEAMASS